MSLGQAALVTRKEPGKSGEESGVNVQNGFSWRAGGAMNRKNVADMSENKKNTLTLCFFTLMLSALTSTSPAIAQSSYHYYSNPAKVGSASEQAFFYFRKAYYDHIWRWSAGGADSAIHYLNLAIKEDTLYGAAHAFLGHVYQFKTYHPAGTDAFEMQKYHATKALELSPQLGDAYTLMADVRWHENDTAEALKLLRTAIKIEPDHAGNFIWLAIRYAEIPEKHDSAAYYLHKILSMDSEYGQAYAKLATLYEKTGKTDSSRFYFKKVIWHYRHVIPRDQRMMLGYGGLANLFRKEHEYDSAVYYYKLFLGELEPSDFYLRDVLLTSTYKDMFTCYLALSKISLQKLVAENEKIIKEHPANDDVILNVLYSYMALENDTISEKYALPLTRKLRENSEGHSSESHVIATYTEVYLLESLERKDEAISILSLFEKDHPDEPLIHLELARMHISRKDYDKGIEYLFKARNHLNELVTLERFKLYLQESYFDSVRHDERFVSLISGSKTKQ